MPFHKNVFSEVKFSSDKMRKINLYETNNFFCDIYCLEPGQVQKPHKHVDADKIYFVLEGQGLIQIGEEENPVKAGDICLAKSGIEHGVRNTTKERLTLLVFMSPNPNV